MIKKEYTRQIEGLLDLNHWYIISPFLKIYPYESDFDNLEEYYEKNYLGHYYESIKKILFQTICYYDSIVYLTEFYDDKPLKEFEKYKYQDFRLKGLDEISTALDLVIMKGKIHMNVYIPCKNSLITIGSGFDTTIFSEEESFIEDVKIYVKYESLFLLRRE